MTVHHTSPRIKGATLGETDMHRVSLYQHCSKINIFLLTLFVHLYRKDLYFSLQRHTSIEFKAEDDETMFWEFFLAKVPFQCVSGEHTTAVHCTKEYFSSHVSELHEFLAFTKRYTPRLQYHYVLAGIAGKCRCFVRRVCTDFAAAVAECRGKHLGRGFSPFLGQVQRGWL